MEHQTLPPPYYHQENEDLPRGRRKNGPIPQPTGSQYRPPQLDTNPKVRKDNTAEKRKRAVPTKSIRPSLMRQPCNHLQLFPKLQKTHKVDLHP